MASSTKYTITITTKILNPKEEECSDLIPHAVEARHYCIKHNLELSNSTFFLFLQVFVTTDLKDRAMFLEMLSKKTTEER